MIESLIIASVVAIAPSLGRWPQLAEPEAAASHVCRRATTPTGRAPRRRGGTAQRHDVAEDAVLVAPLSGRECLVYCLEIHQLSPQRRVAASAQHGVRFGLQLHGDLVTVEPHDATLMLTRTYARNAVRADQWTPTEAPALKKYGLLDNATRTQVYSFHEAIIEPGSELELVGVGAAEVVRDAPHDERTYRGALPTRLCFASSAAHPVRLRTTAGGRNSMVAVGTHIGSKRLSRGA